MSLAAAAMDRMYRRQRHIYDASRKFYLLGRDPMIRELDVPPGGRVLEIACGTGRNLVAAAKRYPNAHFHGLDVSATMLATATWNVSRAGLRTRVALAAGDATAFDPMRLFGVAAFERIIISYALSMIPAWREVLAGATAHLAPGGALHVVDFGDGAALPAPVRQARDRWLALFDVVPRSDLAGEVFALADARRLTASVRRLYGGYAARARLTRPLPPAAATA